MTLPSSGPYAQLMGSFFGYLDTEEQQKLWSGFLQNEQLSTNPADTDTVAQAQFMSYIQSNYDQMQELQLSPTEVQRRHLVFTIFDIILLMMRKVQDTVGVQQGQLVFNGKMQEQYTNLMSRVPIYLGGASDIAKFNVNPAQFTLGYNNISVKELLQYALASGNSADLNSYELVNAAPTGNNPQVNFSTSPTRFFFQNANGTRMTIVPDLGAGTVTVTVYQMASQPPPPGTTQQQQNHITFYQEQQVLQQVLPITGNDTGTQLDSVLTGFIANVNPFLSTISNENLPRVPYAQQVTEDNVPITTVHVPGESDDAALTASAIADLRAQKNSVMQQYIEAARSRRETIKSQGDQISTNLDTSRQSIKGQAGILTSVIQQARNILDSIFKN